MNATELYENAMEALNNGDIDGIELLKEAAEQGNAYAQNNYAMLLYTGDIIVKDEEKAFKWFRLAAEGGIDESQFHLGLEYFQGKTMERDYREALKWFRAAAENGYPPAQYYLGLCYYNGYGVFRDYGLAIRWFTLASDMNYSPAIISLADAYMNNPERDYKEAYRLYKRASESGDERGYYKLGCCYYKGKGTPRNFIEASKCFRRGMEISKDTDCQYMLAMMYIKGEGVQKNHSHGMAMVRNAAQDGNKDARKYLKMISFDLGQDDIDDPEINIDNLNTPDYIAGVKGAENGGWFSTFLRKKL